MDLVRLGLERGASAREALAVTIELIEAHGQGGSGYADTVWPYHNSFVLADRHEAFLLEASARHWAVREIEAGASASNHVTIATDWTRLSAGCEAHARERGWWSGNGRLDFAEAYRDVSIAPPIVSAARYRTTCAALARPSGPLDLAAFKQLMRDHNGSGDLYRAGPLPDDERYYSVCMHADPVGTTTASMIVELAPARVIRPIWVAFCNPCIAPYLPVFLEGLVPDEMRTGSPTPDAGAWWRFKRLLSLAARDWVARGPLIRDTWRSYERDLSAATERVLASGDLVDVAACRAKLTAFMRGVWMDTAARLDALERQLERASPARA
jgi:secernin